jgi:hypothetical protein
MKKNILFVPGIMGTSLLDVKNKKELWGENIFASFNNFASNAGLLKLPPEWMDSDAVTAEAVRETNKFMGVTVGRIYRRLLSRMRELTESTDCHFEPFPYDWRRDIRKAAVKLGTTVEKIHKNGGDAEHKFTLVAHSMGCLVVAFALLNKDIPLDKVGSLIFVAPPFFGSRSALVALYDTGYLPGFDFIERLLGFRRDRLSRINNMLEVCQSFSSLYQLLPHRGDSYLTLPKGNVINPLGEQDDVISESNKKIADALHSVLTELPAFLIANKVQHVIICGIKNVRSIQLNFEGIPEARHKSKLTLSTPHELSATYGNNSVGQTVYTSVAVETFAKGDGTVPLTSAGFAPVGREQGLNIIEIEGVEHSTMCEDKRVIELIVQYLPLPSTKAAFA